MKPELRDWLLESDPALRWQVERDLLHAPKAVWQATRERVAHEGFGAQLLSHQDPDGQWAGGAYFPKDFFGSPEADEPGQPWNATTWSLKDLREFGLDAAVLTDTAQRLAHNSRWEYDNLPYWGGEVDVCINSFTLATGAWLGADVSQLAAWFPQHQLEDGGWNCEAEEGNSVRSSFHSTLNALRGMLAYEQIVSGSVDRGVIVDESTASQRQAAVPALRAARRLAGEYLLKRKLMYRLRAGGSGVAPDQKVLVGDFVTHFAYPNRHVYSAFAALDYFREADQVDGVAGFGRDPRMSEAIDLVREKRQSDGTWLQEFKLPGRTWFDLDVPEGEPSKWLTLIGTRVLDWWNQEN